MFQCNIFFEQMTHCIYQRKANDEEVAGVGYCALYVTLSTSFYSAGIAVCASANLTETQECSLHERQGNTTFSFLTFTS